MFQNREHNRLLLWLSFSINVLYLKCQKYNIKNERMICQPLIIKISYWPTKTDSTLPYWLKYVDWQ